MPMSVWRQGMIKRLLDKHGDRCHYCSTPVRLRITWSEKHLPGDATIDHKVPRSKGGSNAFENLLVSCYRCNSNKGDQDYDEFRRDPRSAHVKQREMFANARALAKPKVNPPWHQPKAKRVKIGAGTMAAAIERGELDEAGVRKKVPHPSWTDWPWLCELMAPLARDVGLGPWGNARLPKKKTLPSAWRESLPGII